MEPENFGFSLRNMEKSLKGFEYIRDQLDNIQPIKMLKLNLVQNNACKNVSFLEWWEMTKFTFPPVGVSPALWIQILSELFLC